MSYPLTCVVFFMLSVSMGADASAGACALPRTSSSPTVTTTVAELFTSEGCDSCPPADRWFATVLADRDHVVPLAFHVDYWDGLGWKDRFAQTRFAERQRSAVKRQGASVVYTPQLMVDGKDVRGWTFNSGFESLRRAAGVRLPGASLALSGDVSADTLSLNVNTHVTEGNQRRQSALYIAIAENHLTSKVTAGENRGVQLSHDHVVRQWLGPVTLDAESPLAVRRVIPIPPDWKRADLSVATWVENRQTGEVLQALTVPLCAP